MVDRALIEQDLDEYVEGESWPEAQEDGEPETIVDPSRANGVFRRLKRLSNEAALIQNVADDEIVRIKAFAADRIAGIERETAWASRSLEAFARTAIPGSGRKSLPLHNGTLKLASPGAGKVVVDDEAKLVEWATANDQVGTKDDPKAVNLAPSPSKTVIGKYTNSEVPIAVVIDDDGVECSVYALLDGKGEAIPGVSRQVPTTDKFSFVLGGD